MMKVEWNETWRMNERPLAASKQRQQIINEINSLFSLKEKLIDWIDWICLANGGLLSSSHQQSFNSNKKVCLIDWFVGMRWKRKAAQQQQPASRANSTKQFKNCFVSLAALRGCLRPLLHCSFHYHSILNTQRGPQSKEMIIDWFRPFSKSGNQINLSFSLRGPATNQFISHKSKSSWRIALSLCTIPDWRLILL